MKLSYDDVRLVLEHLDVPEGLRGRLSRAPVELRLSDDDAAALNDACVALLQEGGRDAEGGMTQLGRWLEKVIDALNDDD